MGEIDDFGLEPKDADVANLPNFLQKGETPLPGSVILRHALDGVLKSLVHSKFPTKVVDGFSKPTPASLLMKPKTARKEAARSETGIYLHVPFCPSLCSFCGFVTEVDRGDAVKSAYVDALIGDVQNFLDTNGSDVSWVYFGGGTPSTLAVADVARLMETIRPKLKPTASATMEIRIEDVTDEYLSGIRGSAGINRLSTGVQSLESAERKRFGLPMKAEEVEKRIASLVGLGIDFNVDLIFGAPGQDKTALGHTLDRIIALGVPQVTAYPFMPIQGTETVKALDETGYFEWAEKQTEMMDVLLDKMDEAGYRRSDTFMFVKSDVESGIETPYADVSMFATQTDIVGFGPGAYSFYGDWTFLNPYSTEGYIEACSDARDKTFLASRRSSGINFFRKLSRVMSKISTMNAPRWLTKLSYWFWTGIYTAARNWNTQTTFVGFRTANERGANVRGRIGKESFRIRRG